MDKHATEYIVFIQIILRVYYVKTIKPTFNKIKERSQSKRIKKAAKGGFFISVNFCAARIPYGQLLFNLILPARFANCPIVRKILRLLYDFLQNKI